MKKKSTLSEEELNKVSGGAGVNRPKIVDPMLDDGSALDTKSPPLIGNGLSDINLRNTKECIYCGGTMISNRKGKQVGVGYECMSCGATYNPSLPNPWSPGRETK